MTEHFIIHCLDAADALPRRLRHYEAHKAYLAAAKVKVVVSGPLLADDGETMIGSLFLIESGSRAEVEAFNAADPFAQNGIWTEVRIHRFNKRVDNR